MPPRPQRLHFGLIPLGVILMFSFLSCAVPVAPTGGPVDRTSPGITESIPEPNSVNFAGESIRLVFSHYIDQASFQRALSFTPAMDTPPRIRWRGRRADIQLQEPLRPNTTYIITLDTGMRAMQGPALTSPITLAFSTGPVIDEGTIAGTIADPADGQPVAGMDVFAYILADTTQVPDLDRAPHYRTQSDQEGRFTLGHLPEQPFYVVGVEDRNRNRRIDPGEPFAVPPRLAIRPSPPGGAAEPFAFHRARLDTIRPEAQRVRAHSDRRLSVRFSEAVHLVNLDPESWAVRLAENERSFRVRDVFQPAGDLSQIVLLMDGPLPPSALQLRPGAAADSAGNPAAPTWVPFEGSAQPDTARVRFVAFLPERPLEVDEDVYVLSLRQRPGIRLTEPPPRDDLARALTITDASESALPFEIVTANNVDFQVRLDQAPAGAFVVRFDARILGGDQVHDRNFRYLTADETGNIAGYVRSDQPGPLMVELYDTGNRTTQKDAMRPDPAGRYNFEHLPAGTYRIRAFLDADTSGSWSGGSIRPYRPAEPYAWNQDSLRVRPRWETEADTLRLRETVPLPMLP